MSKVRRNQERFRICQLDAKAHAFESFEQEFRARTLAHDVPDTEILQVLIKYGISKSMLPTEMGGGLSANHQLEWLANRRAVELEEI